MAKRAAAVAAAAIIGLTAVSAATASAAAVPSKTTGAPAAHQSFAHVCTVNDNGVNYRGGPGPEYPVLGQVNRGQNLNYRGHQGNWVMGDLWGGATGVWIHTAYLDNC
ncbi:SH3 domain-containing protein [Streptomyces sp. G45]|uniref:SH3 domain-containing protein n=1 Tax=Streptomyces sp. G45 TaxID=3406627 RepID=UPI003C212B6D